MSIWHEAWTPRPGSILDTNHGKVLQELVKGIEHLEVIDLGCGNQGAKEIFPNYTGVDLPDFNVYKSDLKFITEYDIVLMNAFIDVMEHPMLVLNMILNYSSQYVVIHRQEICKEGETRCTKELAYGGWTWHSIISQNEFVAMLVHRNFRVIKKLSTGFDNWEDGGWSMLLKRL